jgi:hypothetical protein
MRLKYPLLLPLIILLLSLTCWGSISVHATNIIADDELAYLDPQGFIVIVDPVTEAGNAPFSWRSPTGGYTDIATIDSNADGVDELMGIASHQLRLLTPVDTDGPMPQFSHDLTGGFIYTLVTAGDFIPGDGGRDEILVQRTDNRNSAGYSVQIYDGDTNGQSWQLVFDESYITPWLRIAAGNIDGLEGDELIMVRNGDAQHPDKRLIIKKYAPGNPGGPWITLLNQTASYSWLDLATGNTHDNNGNNDEIILTRSEVGGDYNSLLVYQFQPNYTLADAPGGSSIHYPYFNDIAVGDVNRSGDDELFLIRDPKQDAGISLVGYNWGSDIMPSPWEQALGRDLQAVAMGDVDGDHRAEVVVAQSASFRIYNAPELNFEHSSDTAATFGQKVIVRLGNYDASGISSQPPHMLVTPTFLGFEMQRAQTVPTAQTFAVQNQGGGALYVHVDARTLSGGDWLDVTPFDALAPATFTVGMKEAAKNLGVGTYDATITISGTSPDGPVTQPTQTVNVRLTVRATGQELAVSPESYNLSMNFGGIVPTMDPLIIRNSGDSGNIFYRITITTDDGGSWLQLSHTSGFTDDTVAVTLTPQNLTAGDYSATITVTADNVAGSPAQIPVSLHIDATGMVVTPTELFIQVFKSQVSPLQHITVGQSVAGSGAIHWRAYVVDSGDWWDDGAPHYQGDQLSAHTDAAGLHLIGPEGQERTLQTIPWVRLLPDRGITPRTVQVLVDIAQAPVGDNHVTILVDGGPGTPNRFQGVDVRILVAAQEGALWLPVVMHQ